MIITLTCAEYPKNVGAQPSAKPRVPLSATVTCWKITEIKELAAYPMIYSILQQVCKVSYLSKVWNIDI